MLPSTDILVLPNNRFVHQLLWMKTLLLLFLEGLKSNHSVHCHPKANGIETVV